MPSNAQSHVERCLNDAMLSYVLVSGPIMDAGQFEGHAATTQLGKSCFRAARAAQSRRDPVGTRIAGDPKQILSGLSFFFFVGLVLVFLGGGSSRARNTANCSLLGF